MPALQLSHEYTDEAKGHGTIQEVHIPRYWNMSDDEASACVVERFDVVPVGMCLSERYQEFRVCDLARFARLETRVNVIDVKIVYGYESKPVESTALVPLSVTGDT